MIAAVNGVCAGGGLHFVADADIVIASSDATFLDPHVSIGQVTAYEAIALVRKSPMEPIMRMALTGRHERISAGACVRARDRERGRRPARRSRRRARMALAETIARNSPAAMRATKQALWGALELGLTDACRAGSRAPDRHVGPPRPGGGAGRVRRDAATRAGSRPSPPYRGDTREVLVVRLPDRGAPRARRLADQQPARPAERDVRADARRVRGRVEGARRRSRSAGHRAHRRGAGVPDRGRRDRDRDRRPGHAALPASRSRTGTSTSPRGTRRCGSRSSPR